MPKLRSNRLAQEKSPYLLQHAANPVDWYPWGDEAFQKAKREDKPIFLSIGYATCHWCHVMEGESFENEAIAKVMNEHFVSIKVDREERPDIDQIYMTAVQAMTGSGGWPLSAFLTPGREPFFCGTYFPPERRSRHPGFKEILLEIARLWREQRDQLTSSAADIAKALRRERVEAATQTLDTETLKKFFFHARQLFDPHDGGFSPAPKFPRPDFLQLLFRIYRRTDETAAWQMAERTLAAMARGGIYDHVGGGFHRYSVDERWLVPHFEKMLYDNALLARSYLEAYQLRRDPQWAAVARETLDYVLREMTAPEGGFYSAQDADSEGEEGKYYVWTERELKSLLTDAEFKRLKGVFNVSPEGNFEGKNILHLSLETRWQARQEKEIASALAKLRAAREKRIPPLKDDKIIASWNSLMISTLALASQALSEERYLAAAELAATFAIHTLWDGQKLKRRYREGEARHNGSLDDYTFLTAALLDLFETDFDPKWFESAQALQKKTDELFWDPQSGGYFFTDAHDPTLIARTKEVSDGAVPSGNSIAALNLVRFYRFTLEEEYSKRWDRLIATFAGRVGDNPQIAPQLLASVDYMTDNTVEIVIAGAKEDPDVKKILQELAGRFLPNKVVALAYRYDDRTLPLLSGKVPLEGRATIYVCQEGSCRQPAYDLTAIEALLQPKTYPLT